MNKKPFIYLSAAAFLLCGCGPAFYIEKSQNEFRDTQTCSMKNNSVDAVDSQGRYFTLKFDLSKIQKSNEESYALVIETQGTSFKNDSHLIVCLPDGSFKIKGVYADDYSYTTVSSSPGYLIGNVYHPGLTSFSTITTSWVMFPMTKEEVNKVISSPKTKILLESYTGEKISAEFTPENFKNFREFKGKCF